MTIRDMLETSRYCRLLEKTLADLRADMKERLYEKDNLIRLLRMENHELRQESGRMRRTAQPVEPAPAVKAPAIFEIPQDWQGELNRMIKEEEDGILNSGRLQEHQSRAHDGPQAVDGA